MPLSAIRTRKSPILAAILAMALPGLAPAGEAGVSRGERALVVVVNLSRLAQKNRAIYRYEESRAAMKIRRDLGRSYGRIAIFEGAAAGHDNFLRAVREAETDPSIRAIDAIVYLHGHPGEIGFVDTGFFPMAALRDELLAVGAETGQGSKLRSLYSDACYGATHVADWLRAGFRAAAGSEGVDTNWSRDLDRWMKTWRDGGNFGAGIRRANAVAATRLTDWLIGGDSHKVAEGELTLRIGDPVDE